MSGVSGAYECICGRRCTTAYQHDCFNLHGPAMYEKSQLVQLVDLVTVDLGVISSSHMLVIGCLKIKIFLKKFPLFHILSKLCFNMTFVCTGGSTSCLICISHFANDLQTFWLVFISPLCNFSFCEWLSKNVLKLLCDG